MDDASCNDWRAECVAALAHQNTILDPMRRDYRGREQGYEDAIILGDMADLARCDIVLANASAPSWGTAMEIYHAFHVLRKLVVAWGPSEFSPWLSVHTHALFDSLSEAICFVKEFEL